MWQIYAYRREGDCFACPPKSESIISLRCHSTCTTKADKSYENRHTGALISAYTRFVQPISNSGPLPAFSYSHRLQFCTYSSNYPPVGWPTWARALDGNVTNWRIPWQSVPKQSKFARELWEKIRRECGHPLNIVAPKWYDTSRTEHRLRPSHLSDMGRIHRPTFSPPV